MQTQLPIIIRRKLDRLKRSLRFYAALGGITALLLTVILLCLLDLALDRFFEFPLVIRIILLPMMIGTIGYVLWQRLLYRCFAPMGHARLAGVLEHYIPHLNESLLTAVEWRDNNESDFDLMQHTINEAAAALRGVNVRRFFRTGRLASQFLFSILCAALAGAGSIAHSELVSLWFSRNILLSQKEYPRRSELLVDGFQKGRVRIGRGDSFTLSVRAHLGKPLVPETVRVRIGIQETGYRTLLLDQFRVETREGVSWRVFSTTFPEMLETVNLQISGADSTLNDLCIEVVPTPTLTDFAVKQCFPDYIRRPVRTILLPGRTMVPDGTAITITAKSTKPLQNATAIINQQQEIVLKPKPDESFDMPLDMPFDVIALSLPVLREEAVIEFHLLDVDSLGNRHLIKAELDIIKDQPPVVTARLEGIGPAITPDAVLPIAGEITDDNGLASAVCRYITEPLGTPDTQHTAEGLDAPAQQPARQPVEGTIPITGIAPGQTLFPLEQTFAVTPLSVLPGDKLGLSVEASDLYDLDSSTGQVGTGPRWTLEIVTPEKLKSLLETREIALRQRFDVVIGEVERTKTILKDYSLEPTEQQMQQAAALTLENSSSMNEDERQRKFEEQKQKILDTVSAEQSDLGRYHISRMLRDTQKEVYDLLGIVGAFRTIRQEMINNRIFSEDERRRIDQAIMQPIQELIGMDFPGIDQMLGELNQMLSERAELKRPETLAERQKILEQFDKTVMKMIAIRDKMASMESFNEVIELLRSIIKQQQELRNETIEERKKRLRELSD